jgi:hypothetical protein
MTLAYTTNCPFATNVSLTPTTRNLTFLPLLKSVLDAGYHAV